jgi:hypothetical protein
MDYDTGLDPKLFGGGVLASWCVLVDLPEWQLKRHKPGKYGICADCYLNSLGIPDDESGEKCGLCNFYIGSKTAWPDGSGGYIRTDSRPSCSKKENSLTRYDDKPCELYERCALYGKSKVVNEQ